MVDSEPDIRERRVEGPGRRLRRAREKRGLSTADAADALHLGRNTVEALDNDAFDRLPPVTFVKGYLRAYARLVNLPEEDVLQAFGAVRQPEAERPLKATVGRGSGAGPWLGVLVALTVLAGIGGGAWAVWQSGVLRQASLPAIPGLAGLFGIDNEQDDLVEAGNNVSLPPPASEPVDVPASERPSALAEPPASFLPEAVGEPGQQAPGTALPGALDSSGDAADDAAARADDEQPEADAESFAAGAADAEPDLPAGGTPRVEPSGPDVDGGRGDDAATSPRSTTPGNAPPPAASGAVSAPDPTTAAREATPAPPPPNTETLRFSFEGESWMEVTDARGERLLFGLISGSDETVVRGVPPITLVVGDVGRVTVRHEGDPVSLEPFTRGRVARLTVGDG